MKENIIKTYHAEPIQGYDMLFMEEIVIPIITFNVVYISIGDYILKVTIRNCKNKNKFISDCYQIYSSLDESLLQDLTSILKVKDVCIAKKFSSIILLPYAYYCTGYEQEDKNVLEKTITVFPIYDCEFFGTETVAETKVLINKRLDYVDWDRNVCPKIKIAYKNYSTQGGTKSKTPKLSEERVLMREIDNLRDENSYIKFENYKNESFEIKLINNQLTLLMQKNILFAYDNEQFKEVVHEILINGYKI